MEIGVSDRQTAARLNHRRISRRTRIILNASGLTEAEVSLSFVDDTEMADLNRRWRGREGPTNVLSFSLSEGEFGHMAGHSLGDVVICVPVAMREAEDAGKPLDGRLDELLVHGLLHLLGHDHQAGADRAEKMENETARVLAELKKRDGN